MFQSKNQTNKIQKYWNLSFRHFQSRMFWYKMTFHLKISFHLQTFLKVKNYHNWNKIFCLTQLFFVTLFAGFFKNWFWFYLKSPLFSHLCLWGFCSCTRPIKKYVFRKSLIYFPYLHFLGELNIISLRYWNNTGSREIDILGHLGFYL